MELKKNAYKYYSPSVENVKKTNRVRELFAKLAQLIDEVCPASRERSIAHTELETAAMWAIKAVIMNDPTPSPE